jgi:hypothetical protein
MPESVRAPQQPVFFDVSDPQELGTPETLPAPLTRRSTNMAEGVDVGGLAMAAREVSSGFHVLMCCHLKILHGKCE